MYHPLMTEAGMLMRWRWRTPAAANQGADESLLNRLLELRGLDTGDAAERFLNPKLTHLHDPADLPGITPAAERLKQAVRSGQPVVIYGDYDVDGITASAILWHVLSEAGADVSTYIPHRIDEGYGLNSDAIRQLASSTPTPLIVSVDCGITAHEPARVAREHGVDLIITDHHTPDPVGLPDAHTLVHPRITDPQVTYPFGELCGAGVAFKLAWQFAKVHCGSDRVSDAYKSLLVDLLSLAALGTVADVVPLVDENRVITAFGLGQVKRTRFAGLNALIDAARLREERISAFHVGFVLGPRLNACGRMGHAQDAVRLLTEAEGDEARQIASMLSQANDERRATERAIIEQAHAQVEQFDYASDTRRALVLANEGWHPGVLGIVASRMVEKYARPVVMLNVDNGSAHGSARSVDGVSILDALRACDEHLTTYGGHAMAAGMRLPSDNVEAFREALVEHVNTQLEPSDLTHVLDIDANCSIGDVSLPLWDRLERMAPFGRSNPAPTLCMRNVRTDAHARRCGQNGRHMQMTLRARDGASRPVRCIAFGLGDLADRLPAGVDIDVAFQPKVGEWQGQRRAELHVRDVRLASGQSTDSNL